MAHPLASIDSLSNEILIQCLSSFSTHSLLPLASVCRRWRGLVGRLHYGRLITTTRLQMRNYELLLESYHPVDKLTTPSLSCDYLGTDGLPQAGADANMVALNRLYTRFRPYFGEEYRHPPGQVPAHNVHLESEELFSQLCTTVELVQNGPRKGLFTSRATVCDHVVRIPRDYLRREAVASAAREEQRDSSGLDGSSILWTNPSRNVGLRFRVVEDQGVSVPTFVHVEEDPPVSYRLEYHELLIRTNELYLSLEVSESQQVQHADKVTIFIPFARMIDKR